MERRKASPLTRFRHALAFLTRLPPPEKHVTAADLAEAVRFFIPVGLLIGALLTLATWLIQQLCLRVLVDRTMVALLTAWAWLVLEIAITRGLHWDGLVDLGDAKGSGTTGERFHHILKDSRMGSFGALHLLLAFSGHWLTVALHVRSGTWMVLLLAPAWARASAIWLASWTPAHQNSVLGRLACDGAERTTVGLSFLWAFLILALPKCCHSLSFFQLLGLILAEFVFLLRLHRLALQESGLNGDFLGACIQWSQLLFLLCTL